jgi:hypothetical protein
MSHLRPVRKYEPVLLFSKDGQGRDEPAFVAFSAHIGDPVLERG